ncbi:hypothetical protein MD484_g8444, partial [Candolleomyces efflorescens]
MVNYLRNLLAVVAIVASVGNVVASPVEAAPADEIRCLGETNNPCPTGWTCCGPIFTDIGGVCRLLGPEEVCAL